LWERDWLKALLLVAAVLFAYQPAWHGGFVWDDDAWITKIPGSPRNGSGLCSIWFRTTASQYYPLTGTTFWLDYHLWGFQTLPYHMENILLHALAALLFWKLLQRLQVPGAWLAAAIFALHPVMVESVGWITERRNVLSLVFYLGALLVYLRCTQGVSGGECQETRTDCASCHVSHFYGLAFVLFLCALLSKTTAFSLPAVILLINWWQRGRIRWRMDVLPTLPFFGLSVGLCLVTAWLEKNHVGARGPDFALSFPERCLIAGHVFWFYIGKLLWPAKLCFVYPRWHLDMGSWWPWLYPATAVGMLLGLWLARTRIGRGPAVAAFFFVGTLFPVLGFMNAYFMRYSFVCDHWVYLSSLGPIALTVAVVVRVAERLCRPAAFYAFTGMVLAGLAVLTWRQAGMYADNETLWRTTLARNPDSLLANNNIGVILVRKGQLEEAIAHFQKALQDHPDDPETRNDLAVALAKAHGDYANTLVRMGRDDEAMVEFRKALEFFPYFADARRSLAVILLQKGRVDEAIAQFQKIREQYPDDATASFDLGNAYFQKGQMDEAAAFYQSALKIKPDDVSALNNLGMTFFIKGRMDEAAVQFRKALALQPDFALARTNLTKALLQKERP
jgi:tetratricopeptide (TPR) repeat protein